MRNGITVHLSGGVPSFVEASAPTDGEVQALLQTVMTRLNKLLTRRGVLIEEMGQTHLAEPDADWDEARTMKPLAAAISQLRHRRLETASSLSVWAAGCQIRVEPVP